MEKLNVKDIEMLVKTKLLHNFGVTPEEATDEHFYKASALCVRELMSKDYGKMYAETQREGKKQVYYLCMEFLLGRSLKNNLYNLNLEEGFQEAFNNMGVKLEKVYEQEPDAGLGNGGLGRLAACFLDALATQGYPAIGYSLRYEYGIFAQKLIDGWQTEMPEFWLPGGSVWLQAHPEKAVEVKFCGHVEESWSSDGYYNANLVDSDNVIAVPYDMIISGKDGNGYSRLRLWAAESKSFDMKLFNDGEYVRAIEKDAMTKSITKVLYPGDNHYEGKSLRLYQQYFLVSATIQDIVRRHVRNNSSLDNFSDLVAIHLNDTHPVLAVPELMRIIVDECGYGWDEAWNIVSKTMAYTNHTVMREALECWGEDMFKLTLPRIYQIITEMNRRFCADMHEKGVDGYKVGRMAIVNEGVVKMANLAVVSSHKVNGVSALHSEILKETVFNDFYTVMPDKFTNVTNGIAHRRWLCQSNPGLAQLIKELIGDGFIKNAAELEKLLKYKDDETVLKKLQKIKHDNKVRMAKYIKEKSGISVDPNSVFDVQVKRMHEYKRQLLNALHIMSTYQWLRENPNAPFVPKTYIFGAKAASGYIFAKEIIRLIIAIGDKINNDERVNKKLKVVFLEDYRVTIAERLIPSAEISEQISLAGTEASGTGNMKFMINGALTIGTLDGANVEINNQVGNDNMFIFGMTTEEVKELQNAGYHPDVYYYNNHVIKSAMDEITFMQFKSVGENLFHTDPYMVLGDFADYSTAQQRASAAYLDKTNWNRMSLINIAKSGLFAADRAIREYSDKIWSIKPSEQNNIETNFI